MNRIIVEIPDEVLMCVGQDRKEAASNAKKVIAMDYYKTGKVSLGYCAAIAEMNKTDFIRYLGEHKISIFRFNSSYELDRDIQNACNDSSVRQENLEKQNERISLIDQKALDELTKCLVEGLSPRKIFLFGSFAEGTQNGESDFDFYIVVGNTYQPTDMVDLTSKAYQAVRQRKTRPVDIIVNTENIFNERKNNFSLEKVIVEKGILLYTDEKQRTDLL